MNSTFPIPPLLTKFILWGIWFSITAGLVMMVVFIRPDGPGEKASAYLTVLPLIPLLISGIIRWVVLPKTNTILTTLPTFAFGLLMAEAGGILGIFLGYPIYVVPALVGLFQFAPFWAGKLKQ